MNHSDMKVDTPEQSDLEADSFEDAQDTVRHNPAPALDRQRSSTSTRSLTDNRSSSVASRQSLNSRPESTASTLSNHGLTRNPSSDLNPPTPRENKLPDTLEESHGEGGEHGTIVSPVSPVAMDSNRLKKPGPLTTKSAKHTSASFQEVQLDGSEAVDQPEERGRQLSTDSPISPVSYTGSASGSRSASRPASSTEKPAGPTASSTFGLSTWGSKASSSKEQTPTTSKKMSGPWGWLSRKKTPQDLTSPDSTHRGETAITAGSDTSSDLTLSKLNKDLPAKDQLKERFKLARIKGEAGVDVDQLSADARSSITSGGAPSNDSGSRPTSEAALGAQSSEKGSNDGEATPAPVRGHKPRAPSLAQSIGIDPSLAPGTVAGINHGPSTMADPEAPVDWDLWQAVVYEGPSAVAKTSAAELNQSIASGIPNPIRGVVWQVLAQSKNEELEASYRELIVRGTDKEILTAPNPNSANPPLSAKSLTSNETTKESFHSSSSSVHSEQSTPATTNGMTSPVTATQDADAKMQAALAAERQKKAKEDIKKLEKTIRKDLGARSNYSKYFAAKEMQDDLFGVCKAYALYDEAVGYAQGMNFIVMPLLFNMPAEEAFCLLVRLMNHYKLRETFTQEMPGLHRQLYQFEQLLQDVDPKLCHHLNRRGVAPSLYATQWFITLFAYKFPLQLVLRIYDLVLSEGLESAILKFGIALMKKNAEKLLEIRDMAALKTFLNERLFDAYIDSAPSSNSMLEHGFFGSSGGSEKDVYRADLLVQDACAVELTEEVLKQYGDEFDSKARAEKERQTELEELRAKTSSQTVKIRSLEERCQKSDAEHVQITQEMIRSRMENVELKASLTEAQKEVEELKKRVEDQPAEVEEKLKEEMDRIMARNTEVQGHNRQLEEQMAEMEKDLVETKMKLAETNDDHETLKQKWDNLRKALGD